MYLLIDECCSPSLANVAKSLGHTPQRTTEIVALGRGAADFEIYGFANRHGAVVVSNNREDFRRLAVAGPGHAGIILMPDVVGREAAKLFARILPLAETTIAGAPNMIVDVDEMGRNSNLPVAEGGRLRPLSGARRLSRRRDAGGPRWGHVL